MVNIAISRENDYIIGTKLKIFSILFYLGETPSTFFQNIEYFMESFYYLQNLGKQKVKKLWDLKSGERNEF